MVTGVPEPEVPDESFAGGTACPLTSDDMRRARRRGDFDACSTALGTRTPTTLRRYAGRHGWDPGTVTVTLAFMHTNNVNRIEQEASIPAPLSAAQRARLAEVCGRTSVTRAILEGVVVAARLQAP